MRKFLALLPLAALSYGCSSQEPDQAQSDLTFAHYQAESAFGGPLGRLEALRQGFTTNFTSLKICVELGKEKISDEQMLLESRLAYATWMAASGHYDESDWEKLAFVGQTKCDKDDKSLAGFISLVDLGNLAPGEQLQAYQEQEITCKTEGNWKSCSGKGVTLGWGGPGSLSTWYLQNNPDKWTKLELYRGSSTTLSPYVDWFPITEDIARSKNPSLTAAKKQALTAKYEQLAAETAPTMASLAAYVKELEAIQLTGVEDPVFKKLAKQFYDGTATSFAKKYRGERGAFATLLHEVGHQFGMDHAHHPGSDSVTGQSSKATQNGDGQWVSDYASMAYGLPYLFLTDDDQLGIQSDAASVRSFMASHK